MIESPVEQEGKQIYKGQSVNYLQKEMCISSCNLVHVFI